MAQPRSPIRLTSKTYETRAIKNRSGGPVAKAAVYFDFCTAKKYLRRMMPSIARYG